MAEEKADSILVTRMKECMRVKGYTAQALSRATGLNPATLSLILGNKRMNPRARIVNAIADALQVNMAYLLGNTDDPTPSSRVVYPAHSMEMLHVLQHLSDEQGRLLLDIGRVLMRRNTVSEGTVDNGYAVISG